MTSRAWLLVGFLLVLLSFSAFAEESISATPSEQVANDTQFYYMSSSIDGYSNTYQFPNLTAIGTAAASSVTTGRNDGHTYTFNAGNTTDPANGGAVYLWIDRDDHSTSVGVNASKIAGCATGTTPSNGKCVITVYSCPATGGWTLVNQSCVRDSCGAGEVRNEETGACTLPQPNCTIPNGSAVAGGYYNVGTSGGGSPPPSPCLSQCRTSFEGDGPYEVVINGVKNYFIKGIYYSTGETCSPDTPITDGLSGLPSASCGAGMQQGTINGQTVCVNPSTSQPVPTTPPSTSTTNTTNATNPDGSTTETTTTTNPDGTTTSTSTTTNPDGTTTTVVTSNATSDSEKLDGIAKEDTQKEILKELQKTHCEKNPDSAECKDPSLVDIIETDLLTEERSVSITPVSVGPTGSCPSDTSYTLRNGQQIVFSWSAPCQFATGIRPVVLSIAWLSAALILIGAFRQET